MKRIDRFKGQYEFLSNFFPSPVVFQGKEWPSVEHAYQAMKTRDKVLQEHIRNLPTPEAAKKAGKALVYRSDWEKVKYNIMDHLVFTKFFQNRELAVLLVATADCHLIEGNWWHDNEWGDCTCEECSGREGYNNLGKILMNTRTHIAYMGIV